MNTTDEKISERRPEFATDYEKETTAEVVAGGSMVGAIAGLGATVLAIISLAHVFPNVLLAIAVIGAGVAFFVEGGTIAARFQYLLREMRADVRGKRMLGSGASVELIAGVSGIVLGILALLGIASAVLISVAVIAFGCALLLGSGTTTRLGELETEEHHQIVREIMRTTTGIEVLVGFAAVVLGILALCGVGAPLVLPAVALICVGASIVLAGTALVGKLSMLFTH